MAKGTRLIDLNDLYSSQVYSGCLIRCWRNRESSRLFWVVHESGCSSTHRSYTAAREYASTVEKHWRPYPHLPDGHAMPAMSGGTQ